ncbi:hypothetical protein ATN84_23725 [Paramesorhizobium deserti]|uniref:Uncharacterized protein n=1 Tax=Paramesorhizobium deserti TaxID=1494590 RepID=A0A135HYB0_9HYPH|nr:hypothetical protein [Paramesorhizobium deserti]KXF78175.1 hypothetical protein ATN84_23725 [Paramesorhizobium deserti]
MARICLFEGLGAPLARPFEHALKQVLMKRLKMGRVESGFRAETVAQFEQPDRNNRMLGRF